MNWHDLQENSERVLCSGLLKLKEQAPVSGATISETGCGNYLIQKDGMACYIGEAKNLTKRLKQQFSEKTSTFFKNYQKEGMGSDLISSFKVGIIRTDIGRKEVEAFGIVNLPTTLNRFQLGKSRKVELKQSLGFDWDDIQMQNEGLLREGGIAFLGQIPQPWFESTPPDQAGAYMVLGDRGQALYIGESSNLVERYKTHSGSTYFSALRRHIGTAVLGFNFVQIKSKKKNREFLEQDDQQVTEYLRGCKVRFLPVRLGRFELEEHLIRAHKPLLNRKGNK